MPFIAKALLLALKSKRGRELLLAAAVGAFELARSAPARKAYRAGALRLAGQPRVRDFVGEASRKATSPGRRR